MDVPQPMFRQAVRAILDEAFIGPPGKGSWVVSNTPGSALLPTLATLDAAAASARDGSHPSIAAHANHLRFSLSLANRWAAGENPYANADWAGSWWAVQTVSPQEWERLRADLQREYEHWREAILRVEQWDEISVGGLIASVAHAMYHLGAVRQHVPGGPA